MFLSNCKAMPTSSQFSFRSWSRHGRRWSTQPLSLPQDPTWQQRLAIPVKQMNEAMFSRNKSYLETPQNCHQQSPIASRESQLWRGAFPKESWQDQTDPAGGKQLQTFSRKSSRLWKWDWVKVHWSRYHEPACTLLKRTLSCHRAASGLFKKYWNTTSTLGWHSHALKDWRDSSN